MKLNLYHLSVLHKRLWTFSNHCVPLLTNGKSIPKMLKANQQCFTIKKLLMQISLFQAATGWVHNCYL